MSEERVSYYSEDVGNNWEDSDDLQTLMHAAADADARDNEEALNQGDEISGYRSSPEQPKQPKQSKQSKPTKMTKTTKTTKMPESSGSRKRKHSETEPEPEPETETRNAQSTSIVAGHANVVAAHYNTLKEKGLDERLKSRIFYMRNFNNWIKSMLINEYLTKVKEGKKHNCPVRVMDMCCGKGGDLLKWRKGNITHLICTDIASVSLEQCESRYREMRSRNSRDRNSGRTYEAEFIVADCTRVHLRKRYRDPSTKLDLVSCQFAFHYSFESLPQADCMLRNAAECLQPGGYLIGTIPNADDIVARRRTARSAVFGNDVYQINFLCDAEMPPLFGAKYNFHLDGVVDCPEFLVHFPLFVKLARKHGLQLVQVERFDDFFHRMKEEGSSLLQKMQSLETYPPFDGAPLLGTASFDYKHCEEHAGDRNAPRIGTLSRSEWEAAGLYLTFAFQKVKTTWDSQGKPQYEFDN